MVYELDGSTLEGGGQLLRMSVALSCLGSIPICVKNIRAGRKKGGLAAQHLKGIELARDICSAKVTGDCLGSTEVTFSPSVIKSGSFSVDTKTAGSVCLLFQVALPVLIFGSEVSELILKGGTNADMAPPIEYTCNVLQPMLKRFGINFDCTIIRRGFYPAGQGVVEFKVHPVKQLSSVNMTDFGQITKIYGVSYCAGVLPFKIADQMAKAAESSLQKLKNIRINIASKRFEKEEAFGNGSGIHLVAETSTGCLIGSTQLGRRGVEPAQVGRQAAADLLETLERRVCVDSRMQDQLIIFMALAAGKSKILTGPITLHTQTAVHFAQVLTEAKFKITEQKDGSNIIECDGIGRSS